MSTHAHFPLSPHRLRLPNHRHMSQLGFLMGAAAGALSYVAHPSVEIALFVFALIWYGVSYGVARVAAHPDRRVAWIVHATLLPVTAIVGTIVGEQVWSGQLLGAMAVGIAGGVAVQAAVTSTLLRGVVADQRHDLRQRLGLE